MVMPVLHCSLEITNVSMDFSKGSARDIRNACPAINATVNIHPLNHYSKTPLVMQVQFHDVEITSEILGNLSNRITRIVEEESDKHAEKNRRE